MKQFQLIAILLLIISMVKGQQNLPPQKNDLDLMKKLLNQNFLLPKNLRNTANIKELFALNDDKAKFLYETEKGEIYALPPDKMPYLKPEFHSNMPVDKKSPEIYIPNPLNSKK